jgi:hypothetical protein
MTSREPFYECVLISERNEYHFHLRAWTAEEAEAQFRAVLQEHGVAADGIVRVLGLNGAVLRTGVLRYAASARS